MSKGFIRLTKPASIGGTQHAAGAVLEVDANLARELLSKRLAVPAAGPGRCLTGATLLADVKPTIRGAR